MTKYILIFLLIFNTQTLIASESELLDNLKKGNTSSLSSESMFPSITNLKGRLLDSYIDKQRIIYSKFDIDLLYKYIARDNTYQYEIFFDYISRKCMMIKNKRDDVKLARTCSEKANLCMSKYTIEELDDNVVESCFKAKECKVMKDLDKGNKIDIEYCKNIFKRRL